MAGYELIPIETKAPPANAGYDLVPIEEKPSAGLMGELDKTAHTLRAIAETGAALATGAAAFPISKATKWTEYVLSGGDLTAAQQAEERAAKRIQFEPTTEEAKGAMKKVGEYVLEPIFGTLKEMGQLPGESWKSPTMRELGGDIAEIGGPIGIHKVAKSFKREPARPKVTEEVPEVKTSPIETKEYVLEELPTESIKPIDIKPEIAEVPKVVVEQAAETKTAPDVAVKTEAPLAREAVAPETPKVETPTPEIVQPEAIVKAEAVKETATPKVETLIPTGETKESQLAKRAESDAIENKLTEDFGDLTEYKTMNMKEQAGLAQKIMDADYEQAKRMAMGKELPPQGVREATVYEAVKIRALKEGDVETLRQLATESSVPTRLSEYGQAIKAADSRIMDDPVKVMQDVAETRAAQAKKTGAKPKTPEDTVRLEELRKREETAKTALDEYIAKVVEKGVEPPKPREIIPYGSMNKIITKKDYEVARNELRKEFGTQLNVGLDPVVGAKLVKVGVYHLEAGARSFKAWSANVVKDVGIWVKPHLSDLWRQTREVFRNETKKTPEETRLQALKTRLKNETGKYETKLTNLDFSKKEKRITVLDPEAQRLKAEHERAKQNYQAAAEAMGTVTKEEATNIVNLSKAVAAEKAAMEAGGDRFKYGAAKVAYENYVLDLKGGNAPIKTLISNRMQEAKTTWKDNKAKAVFDVGKDTLQSIADNSIAMVATLDNSFLGRQGLKTLMTHPTAWWPGAKNSFIDFAKTIGGKNAHDALMADIYSRENYLNGEYQRAKIIAKTEEPYPSTLPERIPGIGRVFEASEYAFTGSGMRMRADLYDLLSRQAKENGVNMLDKANAEGLGKLINSMTARGQWGNRGDSGIVRVVLWAPKMLKGNWDVLTMHHLGAGLPNAFLRKQAAMNLLKIVAETGTIMTIANALNPGSAEIDPRSSGFGKIKVGDTSFDITGGTGSLVVLASRIATRSSKSTRTGKVKEYGTGYGESSPWTALLDFLTNKTSPPARVVVDWLKGKNFEGSKFTWGNSLYRSTTPLIIQQSIELKDNASADRVAGIITDAIGISASQPPKKQGPGQR